MRLRKIKGATDRINLSNYIVKDYKEYKGQFKTLFNNDNPIHVEIGMGKGNFIIGKALANPDINFIGIEKFDSVLVRAVEKIDELNLPNLKLIMMDAKELSEVFDKEIDTLYLNFSDPWPKKRHALRRLTSITFLKEYDNIFKNKKTIIQKTDNRKLFEYSLMSFVDYGYKIEEISLDLYKDEIADNIPTEYEIKYRDKGPIYMVKVSL